MCAGEYARSALGHSAPDSLVFLVVRVLSHPSISLNPPNTSFTLFGSGFVCVSSVSTTSQVQPRCGARRAQARQHCRAPPAIAGAVFGTYGTLWGHARSLGNWREVVWSGVYYARVGVYALEAYGIFKVRFVFFMPFFPLCFFESTTEVDGANA